MSTPQRRAPAPFVAAIKEGGDAEGFVVHAEFGADGDFETGSITFGNGVSLRAARDSLRLVVPALPDTLAAALPGRHVSTLVSHRWLQDPRLVIERVDDEDDRLSIVLVVATVGMSAE